MKNFFLLLLSLPLTLLGWWDTPHMAVAQIAYEGLSPEVKKKVDEITTSFGDQFPGSNTFITAACFADDIAPGLKALASWHGSDLPYDPEGVLSKEEYGLLVQNLKSKDAPFAMRESMRTLQNRQAHPFAKWLMLRYLTHVEADLHQPLHCTSLYSAAFPTGDRAGNLFSIESDIAPNLHGLWDSGCGLATARLGRPLDREGEEEVAKLAKLATDNYPPELFLLINNQDFENWREECFCLAQAYCYSGIQPGGKPSEAYLQQGQRICLQQIALAGYRLAYLLNFALGES